MSVETKPVPVSRRIVSSPEKPMLLSVEAAAELLKVHPRTLYVLFARGELAKVKVAGRWLILMTDIEQFIAQNRSRQENGLGPTQGAETRTVHHCKEEVLVGAFLPMPCRV